MAFNLFGSNKEKMDQKQTDEIKEVTVENSPFNAKENVESNSNFNNPFANTNQTTSNNTEPKLENKNISEPPVFNLNEQTQENIIPQTNQEQQNFNFETNNLNPIVEKKEDTNYDKIQEMIDETVEKLIEEKWEKLLSSVDKVLKWKEKQEGQMNLVKEDIVFMKENLEKIESKIMNKISSYDRNILDVNSEIKALEKVFQKVTPTLINNVNELSRIADEFKDAKIENKTVKKEI